MSKKGRRGGAARNRVQPPPTKQPDQIAVAPKPIPTTSGEGVWWPAARLRRLEVWNTIIAGILCFITGLQLWSTFTATRAATKAADAATEAVTLAENTAKQQLRAYVSLADSTLTLSDSRVSNASLLLKNTGQTPAYKLRYRGQATVVDTARPGPTKIADGVGFTDALPLSSGVTSIVTVTIPLDAAEQKAVDESRSTIWVLIEVLYEDAFGQSHHLRFRAHSHADPRVVGKGALIVAAEGNSSD